MSLDARHSARTPRSYNKRGSTYRCGLVWVGLELVGLVHSVHADTCSVSGKAHTNLCPFQLSGPANG
eukprot:95678-Chlamydomonas_euryale.AAC.9